MNIVFCYWGSILEKSITDIFKRMGSNVFIFDEKFENKDLDTQYISKFSEFLLNRENVSSVFSINFVPIIAKVCNIHKIFYISYTVDSPALTLYSKSLASPYCKAFIFDRVLYNRFADLYPGNVFYLPLGSDIDFYDSVNITDSDRKKYDCNISFVGSFHTQYCIYDKIKKSLPEHMRGYVEGLIDAQLNVYGYYLIQDAFSDEWAAEFKKYADWDVLPDYNENIRSIIADNYIGYKCNQQDRIRTLKAISDNFDMDLYTTEDTSVLPKIHNRGIADSKTMMPKIFKCSKINLNMTARTIQSGLPLRIFDIMGAGGFCLTNYQAEIPEYFIPDEDIVMYDSIPDLLSKIEYYLSHDEERKQIAKNGYEKVKKYHTLELRIKEMMTGDYYE